ncbi:MAG: PAS domain S-box protein [Methanoregula sp.]|nr:PAS domain S-box protein [Methanoregula sp.]
MNILVADAGAADARDRQGLFSLFADDSFNLVRTGSLGEAEKILAHDPFDIVLLDLDLEDSRGIATLRSLRLRAPEIPVIILSSSEQELIAQQALKEGAQDYLIREEINSRYLFRTLRYAIERHQIEAKVHRSCDQLEMIVADRTAQFEATNEQLKKEIEVRKKRERELRRSNRLLRVMMECSQALDHAKDERELLTWICEVMVFTGGYPFVWIGFVDPEQKNLLKVVADAGFEAGTLESTGIVRKDIEEGTGPGAIAVRTKKLSVIHNIRKDHRFSGIAAEAKKMGYGSAMGLPILRGEDRTPGGALVLLSRSATAFDLDEKKIFSQLADDISFGIRAMCTREAHEVAEEALHDSEMFYRTLINTLPVGISVVDTDERLAFLSKKSSEMLNLPSPGDGLGTLFEKWVTAGSRKVLSQYHKSILQGKGAGTPAECNLMRFDGSTFWAELRSAALRNAAEEIIGTLVVTQDVTERRQAEEKLLRAYGELENRVRERTADLSSANLKLQKEASRREQLMAVLRDSEQSLRNKQRLLDGAEKLAHIGSWEWDLATNSSRWSDEYFRILGYEPHSVMPGQKIFISAVHPDDRARASEDEKAALEGQKEYDSVFRIIRPDGTIRFVHARGEVLRDEKRSPVGMRGSAQDITERKLAEAELARLATVVAQSDDAIVGITAEGTIFSWNAGAKTIFGYSAEEAQGRNVATFVSPKRNTRIRHNLDRILAGEAHRHFESLCRKKDGSHFYASLTISLVRDENGATLGLIFVARNITERKRIQDALSESEQKYRSLFESMAQAVFIVDPRGNLLEFNPAAERLLAFAGKPVRGSALLGPGITVLRENGTTASPDNGLPWMRAFTAGTEVREVIGITSPEDGKRHWMIVYATPNYRAGEHSPHQVSVAFNDLTDIKSDGREPAAPGSRPGRKVRSRPAITQLDR